MRAGVTPWLIVLADPLAGERADYPLTQGARLGDELVRLFPEGLGPPETWRLYDRCVEPGAELDKADAEHITLSPNDLVILMRTPGTPNFWVQLAITALLSFVSYILQPFPNRPRATQSEQRESGNNQLAGQSNMLRPGGRVPEIMGRVRAYPDLLTMPVERWVDGITQSIEQYFVMGRGSHQIEDQRLGDTPITSIHGASTQPFQPGETVTPITVVKISTTVEGISLDAQQSTVPPVAGIQFVASNRTMISPSALAIQIGAPVRIGGTLSNNGTFFVVSVSGSGPFTYVLEGPVVNEPSANAIFTNWESSYDSSRYCNYQSNTIQVPGALFGIAPGSAVSFTIGGSTQYGTIGSAVTPPGNTITILTAVTNMYGVAYSFASQSNVLTYLRLWTPPPVGATVFAPLEADPTDWHAVPMDDPEQVWIDIAFPGGLLKYVNGERQAYMVQVRADFRRAGQTDPQATRLFSPQGSRQRYLQWTYPVPVASLALPGTGTIEVRLQRVTEIKPDTATEQYVSDTRWQQLRGMKLLPERVYPDVTIMRVGLTNSRSAVSIGEQTYNAVLTRVLPTWNGSAWTVPAPTRRWADNFVSRLKAIDGANRTDAEIDLAGIYALQADLDALDGGAQGQISLTLDQQQDIDAELAQCADVVRAVVYRVGKKVYVSRDRAQANAIALFNGRSKSAEGEAIAVRMKSDDEHDAVLVQWIDEFSAWKLREFQYPEGVLASNVLRIAAISANWPQGYRRARFEWNRVRYRREQVSVAVTEEGRICRPGDVVHVTDDIANLALAAGEVIFISANVLTLDREVTFAGSGAHTILLRDVAGVAVDAVPCVALAGSPNKVQMSRAPTVTIKGRDEALGTLYSFYSDAAVTVRKWLLTAVEANGPYVQLTGQNYSARVYEGDAVALPARPPLEVDV
jgi:hypothetical protein